MLQKSREKALKLHVDDSLITINLCLGVEGFAGSELLFTGHQPTCLPAITRAQHSLRLPATHEFEVMPRAGHALIHFGRHPHRTVPIRSGERDNWVLWYHMAEAMPESSEL